MKYVKKQRKYTREQQKTYEGFGKLLILMGAILFVCGIFIYTVSAQPYTDDTQWGEIHEGDFHIFNKNVWKSRTNFTFNITVVDAIAVRLYVNETPPSENATLSLRAENNTKLFHKETVEMTEDEIINNLWHIEFLPESLDVHTNENYTFYLEIYKNKNLLENPEYDGALTENPVNFKFGTNAVLPAPNPDDNTGSGYSSIPSQDNSPMSTLDSDDDTDEVWGEECCGTSMIMVGSMIGVGSISIHRFISKKSGKRRTTKNRRN